MTHQNPTVPIFLLGGMLFMGMTAAGVHLANKKLDRLQDRMDQAEVVLRHDHYQSEQEHMALRTMIDRLDRPSNLRVGLTEQAKRPQADGRQVGERDMRPSPPALFVAEGPASAVGDAIALSLPGGQRVRVVVQEARP